MINTSGGRSAQSSPAALLAYAGIGDPSFQPATGNISGCAFWIRAIANQTFTLLVRVFLLCYNERADRLASRQATSPSCFRKPFSVKLNGDSYENMYTLQKRKNHR